MKGLALVFFVALIFQVKGKLDADYSAVYHPMDVSEVFGDLISFSGSSSIDNTDGVNISARVDSADSADSASGEGLAAPGLDSIGDQEQRALLFETFKRDCGGCTRIFSDINELVGKDLSDEELMMLESVFIKNKLIGTSPEAYESLVEWERERGELVSVKDFPLFLESL